MESNFNLVLVDLQGDLCQEFERHFNGLDKVSVHHGSFTEVDFDCMVSAANSFGLMDGGVDGAITMHFGEQLQNRVQEHIIKQYHGEQPVGTSFIINANEEIVEGQNKYVAHTPTMRIPMDIRHTENVYQAMRAMLIEVHKFNNELDFGFEGPLNRINTVACTGLGTFCGRVPSASAAKQMRLAYDNYLNVPDSIDWDFANIRNNQIFLNKTTI
jgi:O-acetyl-ADP-ribose deacetylase (regulator of RNase III)